MIFRYSSAKDKQDIDFSNSSKMIQVLTKDKVQKMYFLDLFSKLEFVQFEKVNANKHVTFEYVK